VLEPESTSRVPPAETPSPSHQLGPQALQILQTEHWSLLAARSLVYTEAMSRTSIFVAALTGSVVALALVAQATDFGDGFVAFGLVLLPVVYFLGVATMVRLGQVNWEDARWVQGMNRIRHAYLDAAPELEPYFVTTRLPGSDRKEFILFVPMTPAGGQRDNMVAWIAGRADAPDYGRLRVLRFSRDRQIFGPLQVEGIIDADATIKQQLTLLCPQGGGSQCFRGNLLVIPVGNSFVYVEGLFVQATQSKIPQLQRVILATQRHVVMAPTFQAEKSGCPTTAPIAGVKTSLTSESTTAPKAAPMMTPTARSSTLPRAMKALNS